MNENMDAAIETKGLGKRYSAVTAVEDLSLCVTRGEIYAFLGLNGAGKTTTIRMLLGMVKPTAGAATVLGWRVKRGNRAPWRDVGYMVERPYAYPELTVRENLDAFRRLRPGTETEAVTRVIAQLRLDAYADRRAGTLSQGNNQRLGLAKALLHEPQLLILDEPANGLDPAGIVEIRRLLRELAQEQGVTVFISSHILGEVARLADRIGIIHEGRLLQELDIEALERERRHYLTIAARDLPAAEAALSAAGYEPQNVTANGVQNGPQETIRLVEKEAIEWPDDIAALLVRAGQPPTTLVVEREDLEHYFLRLVGLDEEEPR